ncbi:MAG: hypothetical protein M3Y87_29970 [Myxococcota bacterium]|nr:hypothetical protein [Myxococcota bacterium]
MRELAYDFFQRSPVMAAPLFAMLVFIAIFTAMIVRVARARREEMDATARLALDDEKESSRVEA